MANYKDFEKTYIGSSDIAALTVSTPGGVYRLKFGGDGGYSAYVCTGEVEIGEHYEKVITAHGWIKIFDDSGLTFSSDLLDMTCDIYRAGDYGCIIHVYRKEDNRSGISEFDYEA